MVCSAGLWVVSLNGNSRDGDPAADEGVAGEARRAHAGNGFDAPLQLLLKSRQLFALVSALRGVNAKQQQVPAVEPEVRVFEIRERWNKESRANKEQ